MKGAVMKCESILSQRRHTYYDNCFEIIYISAVGMPMSSNADIGHSIIGSPS